MASGLATRWQVPLLGFMAGTAVADINIASTALVDASRGLDMSPRMVPFAASAMSIVLAATVISGGLAADRIGRRRLLMWTLAVGIAAECLTAASQSVWMFVACRALAGICLGIVFTASFTFVRAVSTPQTLGKSLGLFGAVSGLTMMFASFIGGSLATVQWRVAFLVIPALYAIALILIPRVLPPQPSIGSGPTDIVGQLLLAVGIVGPLYAVSQLDASFTAPTTLGAFAVGVAALIAFYFWDRRYAHPFFPVRLIRDPVFIACILMSIGVNLSNSVLVLQLSNLWQYVIRMDSVEVALAQVPALATGVIASIIAGRALSRAWPEKRLGLLGYACVVLGFGWLAFYRPHTSFWFFVPALILVGGGAQVINVPFGSLLMKVAPAESIGPVTASRSAIGSFANALGMAGTTVLIARFTRAGIMDQLAAAGADPTSTGQAIEAVTVYIRSGDIPSQTTTQHLLMEAGSSYSFAFAITMGITAAFVGTLAVLVAWLLRARGITKLQA